jgi:short chain dehydrogenase
MNTAIAVSDIQREPALLGQTVVVIGESAGIGLETARRASAEGAKLILTGRSPERLQRAASEVHALSSSDFDATDPALLGQFFGCPHHSWAMNSKTAATSFGPNFPSAGLFNQQTLPHWRHTS